MENDRETITALYSDLIYYIERLAGLTPIEDADKFKKIAKKEDMIEHNDENGIYYTISDFANALYSFTLSVVPMEVFVKKGPRALIDYSELTEKKLKEFYLKFARDYTETPGGRYISDGSFSGEDFRDNVLEKMYLDCLVKGQKLVIDFDGDCYGYPVGFLEEAFGGMVRKGYHAKDLLNNIVLISNNDPDLIQTITNFMLDEEQRVSLSRKNKDTQN